MTVQDIIHISAGKFNAVHKSVGVLLHDTGFMRYKKLTADNYDYWYYEVSDIKKDKPNKNNFTYDWTDMELTRKFDFLLSLTKYHSEETNIHKIINNALNILAAGNDGRNMITGRLCYDEVFDMYYGKHKPKVSQLELFGGINC
ncbi:MAG: hypothetical protein FWB95_02645 [Treponema sp.]|nr:hypothetical protein [Treponema sp.]